MILDNILHPPTAILSTSFTQIYKLNIYNIDDYDITLEFSCFYNRDICYIFIRDLSRDLAYHSFAGRVNVSVFTPKRKSRATTIKNFDPYLRNFVLYVFTTDTLENITKETNVPTYIAYCRDLSDNGNSLYLYEFDGRLLNTKLFTSLPTEYIQYITISSKLSVTCLPCVLKIDMSNNLYVHLLVMELFPEKMSILTTSIANSSDDILEVARNIINSNSRLFVYSEDNKSVVNKKIKYRK